MKIKKFNNIWAMGLIIFIGMLLTVYFAKLINPELVVGVAETESIVNLGKYIDNNKWAYYLATTIISFVVYYLFCCACCRKRSLSVLECGIILIFIVAVFLCEKYANFMYYEVNMLSTFILPTIILLINKEKEIKFLYSTVICNSIHFISQALSLQIRNIMLLIASYNFATLMIMMIDVYIWIFILYSYFNIKKEN